jgi:hypothetical protein
MVKNISEMTGLGVVSRKVVELPIIVTVICDQRVMPVVNVFHYITDWKSMSDIIIVN